MIKLIKDGGVKVLDKDSANIAVLLKDGWTEDKPKKAKKSKAEDK